MTTPGSGGRNTVGTAQVLIRAITKNVKKDILKSVREGYKAAEAEAERSGKRAGVRWSRGFEAGVRQAGLGDALNRVWRDAETDSERSGGRAGERYARAYNQSIRRATRNQSPLTPNPSRTPAGGGAGAGGGGTNPPAGSSGADDEANARRREQQIQNQIRRANRLRDRQAGGGGGGGNGGGTRFVDIQFRERGGGVVTKMLKGIMVLLQGIGYLSAGALAALAGQAVIGGLAAIIASLSQITGLVLLLPAALNAVALVVGTLKMGFSGLGDALKAGAAAGENAAAEGAAQQKVITGAIQQREMAERGVEAAQRNRIRVQKDYTDAVKEARRSIEDLNLSLKGSALDEEDALIAVERAKERLANMPSGSTALDYRDANNSLAQAKQSLEETRLANKRLGEDTAEANKKGVEGANNVVAARQAISDANQQLIDSNKQLAEAQKAVAEAMSASTPSAEAFQKAMAKLSPNAQSVVRVLLGLKDRFKEIKATVQQNMFAGLEGPLQNLGNVLIPVLGGAMARMATTLNGIGKDIIAAFAAPDSVDKFRLVMSRVNDMVERMRPGFMALVGVFKNLATVGSEFLGGIGDGFTSGAQKLEKWSMDFDHIRDIISKAVLATKQWWAILKNLGSALVSLFSAAQSAGFIQSIVDATAKLRDFIKLPETQDSLRIFFENGRKALDAVMPILFAAGGVILDIGSKLAALGTTIAPGFLDFVNGIGDAITNLQPALDVIGPKIRDLFSALGSNGGQLGDTISALVTAFSPWLDVLRILSTTLLPTILIILEKLAPLLAALSPVIIGLALAWKVAAGAAAIMNAATRVSTILIGQQRTAAALAAVQGKIVAAATKAWAAVQWVLNAALTANPIGIVVVAIAALVAGVILAYKNSETFRKVVQAAWDGIKKAVGAAWDFIKPIFTAIVDWVKEFVSNHIQTLKNVWDTVFNGIKIAIGIWWSAVKIYFEFLVAAWQGIEAAAMWLWHNVIEPVFNGIKAAIGIWWDGVQIYWGLLQLAWDGIEKAAMWLWHNVFEPVFNGIGETIKWVWENVIKRVWDGLKIELQALGDFFSWIWNTIIKPVWNALGDGIKWVIDNVIIKAFNVLKDAIGGVKDFFGDMVDGIGKLWDGVKKIVAEPINWVIKHVYTDGIKKLWDGVANLVGMGDKKLPDVPELKFASGGVMPGYTPGRDVHNFVSPTGGRLALSGGEAIMRPEWTRAVGGPAAVNAMNMDARTGKLTKRGTTNRATGADYATGGVLAFAPGGVISPAAIDNKAGYGLPNGSNISYGGLGFPSWVYGLGSAHGVKASTYPGHQENDRKEAGYAPNPNKLNRGIDWSGAINQMQAFAQYLRGIAPVTPSLEQIIWQNPQTGEKIGWHGRSPDSSGSYFAGDYSGHQDHVHTRSSGPIAPGMFGGATGSMGGTGGFLDSVGGFVSSMRDQVVDTFAKPLQAIVDKVPTFGTGDFGKLPKALSKKAVDTAVDFAKGKADSADKITGTAGNIGQILTGANMVPLVKRADGTWTSPSPEWAKLIKRESGGNPSIVQGIQDINSGGNEASGLFQIAKGTWAGYGGNRFAPTAGQATPEQQATIAAAIFRKEKGAPWGSGLAGRETDSGLAEGLLKKYDNGGKLKPGITNVINKTGSPEAVLTKPQWTMAKRGMDMAAGQKYLTEQNFSQKASDWGRDALKEVAGEFLDPFGLSGLAGKGIDQIFKQIADDAAQKAVNNSKQAPDGKIAETVVFQGMDPKKVTEEVNRHQNQRGNAYTARYTNG